MALRDAVNLYDDDENLTSPAKKARIDETKNGWKCLICTFDNGLQNVSCEMCNSERANSISVFEKTAPDEDNRGSIKTDPDKNVLPVEMTKDSWFCSTCTFNNKLNNHKCEMCDSESLNQPKEEISKSNFSHISPIIASNTTNSSSKSSINVMSSNSLNSSSNSTSVLSTQGSGDDLKILPSVEHSILTGAECNQAKNTANTITWTVYNDIMYKFNPDVNRNSREMVTFDMDGNLIETKSGKKFATNEHDWKLWNECIPAKLRQLHNEGKYLAIVSNQNGIKAGKTTAKAVQGKVDAIIARLGVPMDFICSTEDDKFRKPRPGMLEFLVLARCPDALKAGSMYVGDAAGREKEGPRGKDFSDSDLKCALNLDIEFQTPERFFLNSTQRLHTTLSIANGLRLSDVPTSPPPNPVLFTIGGGNNKTQDIVLLVAPPASGKTTLCQKFVANGYVRINQDTLKTVDKCIVAGRKHLQQGQSLCVDNTNMDPKARAKWIDLGREFNVDTRCVVLRTPKEVSRSLAMFRMLDPHTAEEDRRHISSIVVNMFFKEPMNWPAVKEGFSRVDSIDWSPVLPKGLKALRLFKMYLKA